MAASDLRSPVRTAGLTVLFVALGGAAAWTVSQHAAPVHPDVQGREAVLDRVAPRVEVASLGNSHARAIDFDALGVRGFHFSLGGSDLFEAVRLFRHARRRLPALREAYVVVSPRQVVNSAFPERHGRRRSVYVQTGDYRPMSGDWRLALTSPLSPLARDDHWAAVFSGSGDKPAFGPDGALLNERPQRSFEAIKSEGPRRAAYHGDLARRSEEAYPGLCADLGRLLETLVEESVGLRLVLYTPPYPRAYYEAVVGPPATCDLRPVAARLAGAYAHVFYLDASTSALSDDLVLFLNADHLNDAGAAAFSAMLRDTMATVGLREP